MQIRQRLGKVAGRTGTTVALVATFSATFVVGLAVHLPLPPSRRLATRALSTTISKGIRGSVEIDRFESLSLSGFEADDVVIRDPEGNVVLAAPRLRARANLLGIAVSALFDSGPVKLRSTFVRADVVDVTLLEGKDGKVTLASTFLPPEKPAPAVPTLPTAPARAVVVDLPAIEIGTIRARGELRVVGALEAEAKGLTGSVYAAPGDVRIDTRPFPVVSRNTLPAVLSTTLDFHFRTPSLFWTDFLASFGDVLFSGKARLNGSYVDAAVDVPSTTTDPFLPFFPGLKAGEPVDAHVEWHGAFPTLDTTAQLHLSQATLNARGRLVATGQGTEFHVSASHVDLSSIQATLPATDLGLDARVSLAFGGGKPVRATMSGTIPATTLQGVEVPESKIDCTVDATGVSGTAWLHEPGMPVEARFNVTRAGDVQIKASTTVDAMQNAPRLHHEIDGRAVADLDATWSKGRIDAKLTADLTGARRGPIAMASGRVTAHAWGEPGALEVDADVRGSQLTAGRLRWARVAATLRGPATKPEATIDLRDDTTPDVRAVAALVLEKTVGLRNTSVTIKTNGETVTIKVPQVQARGAEVDLGKIGVEGLGDPFEAEARVGPNGFMVRATTQKLLVQRVAGLLGLPVADMRGEASLSLDLQTRGNETSGCVAFDATRLQMFAPDIDVSLRARFDGSHVSMAANASVAGTAPADQGSEGEGVCLPPRSVKGQGVVSLSAGAELSLHGPVTDPKSWEGATGTARVSELSIDFANENANSLLGILERIAQFKTPTMTGMVRAHADVVRDSADQPPSWSAAVSTTGFSIELGAKDAVRKIQGADLFAAASMTSAGRVTATACVRDSRSKSDPEPCDPRDRNVLVTFGSVADVDYVSLLRDRARWRVLLATAPLDAKLTVLERSFSALKKPLPWASDLPVDADEVAGWIRLQGSFAKPRFDYALQVLDATPVDPAWHLAETVCALGSYDGARAGLYAEMLHRQASVPSDASLDSLCREPRWRAASSSGDALLRPVGNVTANVDVDWSLALRSSSISQIPWVADIVASLHDIELSDFPVLLDNDVAGKLSISGGIRNLGLDPEFGVQVDVDGLRVGSATRYEKSVLVLRTDDRGLGGTLKLMNPDAQRGMVTRLTIGVDTRQVHWSGGLTPQVRSDESVDTWVEANDFDVALLAPLVSPTLSYLEGTLDGSVYATWSPKAGESAVRMADLTLTQGAFEVPVLGQEFTGATARIRSTGPEQLSVDNLVAHAASGAIAVNAKIDLTNLIPSHVAVGAASDKNNPLRLTYEGIPLGDFDGEVFANVYLGSDRNQALVEFDKAHLVLSESSLRNVQQTTRDPDIVMVPTSEGGNLYQVSRPGEAWQAWVRTPAHVAKAIPWYVRFITRSPVAVSRSDLDVSVATPNDSSQAPLLILPGGSAPAQMQGHVDLLDGKLDVVGKTFEIERGQGRLIFDGDPGEPSINVATRWDAPDGTRVIAEVTGPLKNPNVRFRSIPARPASEILSMILTGTTGTEVAAMSPTVGNSGDTAAAAGVGGGVASVGINQLLQDVSPINVSTRVDTSEARNVRPTIAVQVARNVTAETTVNTGALAPGQTQDVYMVTLDWRFLKEWSMRTTVGNKGSSVFDVVWQHRY